MMCTVQPNAREELLETLDTETVFDYLLQHGVLDNQTVQGITGVETRPERNAALLKHIEDYGTNAVALFINALRQSGQLRLASSIDDTKRIKPVEGSGQYSIALEYVVRICEELRSFHEYFWGGRLPLQQ